MYGIHIDEETREFSVIDTREFALLTAGAIAAGAAGGLALARTPKKIIRRHQLNNMIHPNQRLNKKDSRRVHQERMAMIKAGMDPTAVEDFRTKEMREKYDYKGHRLDNSLENSKDSRSYKLANAQDRRSNVTKRTAIRKLR